MYDELVVPPSVCLEIDRVIGLYNRGREADVRRADKMLAWA